MAQFFVVLKIVETMTQKWYMPKLLLLKQEMA